MALVHQRLHFAPDLILRQYAAFDSRVFCPERAIEALVGAQVRNIERREQHESPAVNMLLDRSGGMEKLFDLLLVRNGCKRRDLIRFKAFALRGMREDFGNAGFRRMRVLFERFGDL